MTDNNVFILFEEIRSMLGGMKGKLKEISKMTNRKQLAGVSRWDLFPVKETVAGTAKVRLEKLNGLLVRQWTAYVQVSNAILEQVGSLEERLKEQGTGREQPPQERLQNNMKSQ